jgi:hypothetical protein
MICKSSCSFRCGFENKPGNMVAASALLLHLIAIGKNWKKEPLDDIPVIAQASAANDAPQFLSPSMHIVHTCIFQAYTTKQMNKTIQNSKHIKHQQHPCRCSVLMQLHENHSLFCNLFRKKTRTAAHPSRATSSGRTGSALFCHSSWRAQEEGEGSTKISRTLLFRTRLETMRQMPPIDTLFRRCVTKVTTT